MILGHSGISLDILCDYFQYGQYQPGLETECWPGRGQQIMMCWMMNLVGRKIDQGLERDGSIIFEGGSVDFWAAPRGWAVPRMLLTHNCALNHLEQGGKSMEIHKKTGSFL